VENSTRAGATLVEIEIRENTGKDEVEVRIRDDGTGLAEHVRATATDPFVTTKTGKRIGLGLALLEQAASQAGGRLRVSSRERTGCEVVATFVLSHIDRKPLGDMRSTLLTLIASHPEVDFMYAHERNGKTVCLDTREIRGQLGEVPITNPTVLGTIREMLNSEMT
jgi:hypothetical protein